MDSCLRRNDGWDAGITEGGKEERRRGFRRRWLLLVIREGRGYRPSRCISLLRTVVRCADLNVVRAVVVRRHVRQRDRHAGISIPAVAAEADLDQRVRQVAQSSIDAGQIVVPEPQPASGMARSPSAGRDLTCQHVAVQAHSRRHVQGAQVRYLAAQHVVAQVQVVHACGGSMRPVRDRDPVKALLCSHRSFRLVRPLRSGISPSNAVAVDDQPRHVRWQHVHPHCMTAAPASLPASFSLSRLVRRAQVRYAEPAEAGCPTARAASGSSSR